MKEFNAKRFHLWTLLARDPESWPVIADELEECGATEESNMIRKKGNGPTDRLALIDIDFLASNAIKDGVMLLEKAKDLEFLKGISEGEDFIAELKKETGCTRCAVDAWIQEDFADGTRPDKRLIGFRTIVAPWLHRKHSCK